MSQHGSPPLPLQLRPPMPDCRWTPHASCSPPPPPPPVERGSGAGDPHFRGGATRGAGGGEVAWSGAGPPLGLGAGACLSLLQA